MQATTESTGVREAVQASPADAAVQASQAIERLLTSFEATRPAFRSAIGHKWAELESARTVSLADIGADCAKHIETGLLAGLERKALVDDCKAGIDLSDDEVSKAIKLHKLSVLSGVDCSAVSYSRVRPLLPLVKREADDSYSLAADREQVSGLCQLVVAGDSTLANRKAIGDAVAKLLGKAVDAPADKAKPADAAVDAPVADEPPATMGTAPLDAAQCAFKALSSAKDTGAAALAFGSVLGQHPTLLGPIVKGLAAWVKSEKSADAARVFGGLLTIAKAQANELAQAGLPIGG